MKILIEELARSLAYHEGKRNEFDACKEDHDLEDNLGHYEGYIADAESLLARCPTLFKVLSISVSGLTV